MESVVNKFVYALETQLSEKKVTLELSAEARAWLAKKGYDPLMGARPMARLIQEQLKQPLAEKLLFGELVNGGHVTIAITDDALHFEVTGKH